MRRVGAAGVALLLLAGLTACGGPADHLRDICGDVTRGTAKLEQYDPAKPATAVAFAVGRFTQVEAAVSRARETALPGDSAAVLRADWLQPAVASMADWEARLQAVRTAVAAGGRPAVDTALAAALALGTEGVDTAALKRAGFDACAAAFTPPDVPATTG